MKNLKNLQASIWASLLVLASLSAETQHIFDPNEVQNDYSYNYKELNNIETNVATHTTPLFGDMIDPASGDLRFTQTDISIPGNFDIPVEVTRTLGSPDTWYSAPLQFGNWSLDIPHIRSTYVSKNGDYKTAYWPNGEACSKELNSNPRWTARLFQTVFDEDGRPAGQDDLGGFSLEADHYFSGDTVYIPGKGNTQFLTNQNGNADKKRRTNKQWDITCVTTGDYEGFTIKTLDGMRYEFTQQYVVTDISPISMIANESSIGCTIHIEHTCAMDQLRPVETDEMLSLSKHYIFMLATKITDKFGNSVEYNYVNKGTSANPIIELESIIASDGRQIDFTYQENRIKTATAITTDGSTQRTWTYNYGEPAFGYTPLTSVDLPAKTGETAQQWQYDNGSIMNGQTFWRELYPPAYRYGDECISSTLNDSVYITITHPDGAKGTFYLTDNCFGQAQVPKVEHFNPSGLSERQAHWIKPDNRAIVLSKKELSLSNGTNYIWQYQYSGNKGYFENGTITSTNHVPEGLNIVTGDARAQYNSTKTIEPDGSYSIRFFDRNYGKTFGNLMFVEHYNASGNLMRRSSFEYDHSPTYGDSHTYLYFFTPSEVVEPPKKSLHSEQLTRAKKQTTTLFDGGSETNYHQEILAFNDFNLVTHAKQSNNIIINGNSTPTLVRFHGYEYVNDAANGVYNLPTTQKISDAAITDTTAVLNETTYTIITDINNGLEYTVKVPHQQKRLGDWQTQIDEYHPNGMPKKIIYNAALNSGHSESHRYIKYGSYKRGQPSTISVPNRYTDGDKTATQTINDHGWVNRFTDFENHTINYTYDLRGRIASVQQNDWAGSVFEWGEQADTVAGRAHPVRTVKRCEVNQTSGTCSGSVLLEVKTDYDSLLRAKLVATKDIARDYTVYQHHDYNYNNQPTFSSYPSASVNEADGHSFSYDALKRPTGQTSTSGSQSIINYLDNNRRELKVKQNDGQTEANYPTTTISYLAYGQPNYQTATLMVSPENVNTEIKYNQWDNITEIKQYNRTDSSITHSEYRVYNDKHHLCKIKRGDVGQTLFNYDAMGVLQWQATGTEGGSSTDCNWTVDDTLKKTFAYDNLGDIDLISFGDGTPNHDHTYSANGHLKQLTAGDVTQTYDYNTLGLLTFEKLQVDGREFILNYDHNKLGHLSSLTYPDPIVGKVLFEPNAFGQVTTAKRQDNTYTYAQNGTYYPTGSLNSFAYGNGITHKATLNSAKLPTKIHDYGNTDIVSLNYSYDKAHNITSIINNVNNDYSLTHLTYDNLDRLVSTTGNSGIGSSAINYDALGNITAYSSKGSALTYHYDSALNRLNTVTDSIGKNNYSLIEYDNRGSITKRIKDSQQTLYSYNLAEQMTSSSNGIYTYDGHNRRVMVDKNNRKTYSMYNQAGVLLYQHTPSGPMSYIYLGNKLIAKDGMIEESSSSAKTHYKPYGETLETAKDDVGYTGHKYDADLGLNYMQARYYDPVLGRFMSNDPVGYTHKNPVMSFNRYMYANNNPYKFIDPDGNSPISFLAKQVAKHGVKEGMQKMANRQMRRLSRYMNKKTANDFTDEVADIIGSLDSSPYEIALEMIPGVGDIYGGAKFGKQVSEAYGKMQDLENKYIGKILKSLSPAQRKKFINAMRNAGVRDSKQDRDMPKTGSGMEMHHNKTVADSPSTSSDPRHIEPLSPSEHKKRHK